MQIFRDCTRLFVNFESVPYRGVCKSRNNWACSPTRISSGARSFFAFAKCVRARRGYRGNIWWVFAPTFVLLIALICKGNERISYWKDIERYAACGDRATYESQFSFCHYYAYYAGLLIHRWFASHSTNLLREIQINSAILCYPFAAPLRQKSTNSFFANDTDSKYFKDQKVLRTKAKSKVLCRYSTDNRGENFLMT